jgi:hypothetical protein
MKHYIKLAASLLLLLCSCQTEHISVQTHYLSRSNLASFYIGTPDPQLHFPLVGQRLLMEWSLPKTYLDYLNLRFHIVVRFGDRSELVEWLPVQVRKGYYYYDLRDQAFIDKMGIKTYKVDLFADDQLIETWEHQLWTELIQIPIN